MPGADRAIIDPAKLVAYCLDPSHPRGRHKARVFRATLGVERGDADWLQTEIMKALPDRNAIELARDHFGSRWGVDIPLARQGRRAVIRTVWIVRAGENVPRFVTCWVL
jgi:hypothetical protein